MGADSPERGDIPACARHSRSAGTGWVWTELPPDLRSAVEAAAGAPVRSATSQPGGFSPGFASVLRLSDGRSVFVKAVNRARNPDSPGMHRREAQVLAALPASVPAPRLLWSHDDGDWVALMTEAVAGASPAQPWRPDQLATYLATAAAGSGGVGTPALYARSSVWMTSSARARRRPPPGRRAARRPRPRR